MAWQPDNRQWIVVAVTFLLAGYFSLLGASEVGRRGGDPALGFMLALLVVIAGALVVWFLQGRRKT